VLFAEQERKFAREQATSFPILVRTVCREDSIRNFLFLLSVSHHVNKETYIEKEQTSSESSQSEEQLSVPRL
jgi:hypothetical protein